MGWRSSRCQPLRFMYNDHTKSAAGLRDIYKLAITSQAWVKKDKHTSTPPLLPSQHHTTASSTHPQLRSCYCFCFNAAFTSSLITPHNPKQGHHTYPLCCLAATIQPKTTNRQPRRCFRYYCCVNAALTSSLIVLLSVAPAVFAVTSFMTAPICFTEVAPTSATAAATMP